MHPISPTLAAMTARAAANARPNGLSAADPGEIERTIIRALKELSRTRPRLVAFAPGAALNRVLALPGLQERLAHPLPRFIDVWARQSR